MPFKRNSQTQVSVQLADASMYRMQQWKMSFHQSCVLLFKWLSHSCSMNAKIDWEGMWHQGTTWGSWSQQVSNVCRSQAHEHLVHKQAQLVHTCTVYAPQLAHCNLRRAGVIWSGGLYVKNSSHCHVQDSLQWRCVDAGKPVPEQRCSSHSRCDKIRAGTSLVVTSQPSWWQFQHRH